MLNPWVIIGMIVFFLVSIGGTGYLAYERGNDDAIAAVTTQQLAKANQALKDVAANTAIAHKADETHTAGVQVVHDTTHEILRTVTLPPDADPYLPVGFVRLFDRAASRDPTADPYPGKSDGEPSDVRVSQAQTLLVTDWADKYYTCKRQVDDTRDLNPVLPQPVPVPATKTLLDRLNPFA